MPENFDMSANITREDLVARRMERGQGIPGSTPVNRVEGPIRERRMTSQVKH